MKKIFLAAVLTGAMAAGALAEYQIDIDPMAFDGGAGAPMTVTADIGFVPGMTYYDAVISGPSGFPEMWHAVWQNDGQIMSPQPINSICVTFCDDGSGESCVTLPPFGVFYIPGPAAPPAGPTDFGMMDCETEPVAVQLTSFVASGDRAVELNWAVEGSDYAAFNLKRNDETVYTGTAFSYTDNVFSGDYTYTLEVENLDGSVSVLGSLDHVVRYFELGNAYPNPFNPTTTISYDLANDTMVNLSVFNLAGQKVTTLVNDARAAGHYEMTFDASALSSGVYFYRIEAGSFTAVNKFTLVK